MLLGSQFGAWTVVGVIDARGQARFRPARLRSRRRFDLGAQPRNCPSAPIGHGLL
jgi:hypothetical protein